MRAGLVWPATFVACSKSRLRSSSFSASGERDICSFFLVVRLWQYRRRNARTCQPALLTSLCSVLPTYPPPALIQLYNFVWDRFRMVRSDYNMQGFNPVVGLVSDASIVAHERMAR